jgi:hypothetical protein
VTLRANISFMQLKKIGAEQMMGGRESPAGFLSDRLSDRNQTNVLARRRRTRTRILLN